MNVRRFDELVATLGRSSPRRRLLAALGAAALGGLAHDDGAAKPVKRRAVAAKAGRAPGPAGASTPGACGSACGAFCDRLTAEIFCDPDNEQCACFRSVTGQIHCVDANRRCPDAGSPAECQQDADCGPNAICGPTAGGSCCHAPDQAQVNICLPLCQTAAAANETNARQAGAVTDGLLGLRDRLLRHE